MLDYVLIAASVALAGFHSGNETGFYCINRLRLRLWADAGRTSARALHRLVQKPQLAISTVLVGTNIGVYLSTVLLTDLLRRTEWAGMRADVYSSLLMPPILLIFSEIGPKSLFQHHAEHLMYRTVWPLRVSEVVFYPLTLLLRWISGLPGKALRRRSTERRSTVNPDAFRFYLREGAAQGVLSSFQSTLAENILRLRTVDVATAMTPLERAVMIEHAASGDDLLQVLTDHRYSRIPIWRDEPENVVGIVNLIDVALAGGASQGVGPFVREVPHLRRTTSVADALRKLRQERQQFAVVTDADGNALGIVTVKDLVEEIVGELQVW